MAVRCVRLYECPNQKNFSLEVATGAIFKAFIVTKHVHMVFIVDPGAGTTETRTFKVVAAEEQFDPAGLAWLGTVDYRGTNWFVGEVGAK